MKILNTAEGPQICVELRDDGTVSLRIRVQVGRLEGLTVVPSHFAAIVDDDGFMEIPLTLSPDNRQLLQLELMNPKQRALVNHTVRERVKQLAGSAVERNSPCPCGSGKKFKNCHAQ